MKGASLLSSLTMIVVVVVDCDDIGRDDVGMVVVAAHY
jgi:hypothetical protein